MKVLRPVDIAVSLPIEHEREQGINQLLMTIRGLVEELFRRARWSYERRRL